MSMTIEHLSSRTTDVGDIPVARVLPNKQKNPIGAWWFLDHAGPVQFDQQDAGLQVGRHPHTNLQTFTWMLQGEVMHHDSLGNQQLIQKGQVNLMTAGTGPHQGISHAEQSAFAGQGGSPETDRALEAVQLWIALPMDQEIERSFYHYPDLPSWTDQGAHFILTTGKYTVANQQYNAPTLQYSPLIGLHISFEHDATITLHFEPDFEYGLLIIKGNLTLQGETFAQNELARFEKGNATSVAITAHAGTQLMLLGGEPLDHKTLIWWNFVDRTKAGLEQSIIDWNNHHPRFGDVAVEMKRLEAPALPENFKDN